MGALTASTGSFSSTVSTNGGKIYLRDDSIEDFTTNGNSNIAINYAGYQSGFTQFRDFKVWNGKAGLVFAVTGSTGASNFYGTVTSSSTITGTQLISNIATGTAPLTVASTTQVSNLNASYLQGYQTATANTINSIVLRDGSGNFSAGTITASLTGTARDSNLLNSLGSYVWSASTLPTSFGFGITNSFVQASNGWQNYGSVMNMMTYSGGGGSLQLYVPYSPTYGGTGLQVRFGNYDVSSGNSWTSWKILLASDNYNSYAPTLTGTGASGTWGISVTGNAATATNVAYSGLTGTVPTWNQSTTGNAATASNASLLGGLALNTDGRADNANEVVRTDANGYIQAGWINSTSGDSGFATRLTRITCSNDNYLRYLGLTDFKVSMGESAKNNYSRRIDYTSDANYHVGSFGHNAYGANETFHGGSGFFDIWSGTNFPGGLTHIHGFNALHYTVNSLGSTGGNAYGWQMAVQYNTDNGPWWRRCSGGSFSSWLRLVSYGNNLSGDIYAERFYDHNNTAYYTDPASTSNLNGLTANSTFTVNNGWSYVANNYGYGIVGLYTSTIFQLVFAMGDAYKTTAGGGINNLYGIAWSHPNAGGIAANLNDHGMIVALNGGYAAAISSSIRCATDMRAPIYYDSNNTGYYTDPASTSILNSLTLNGSLTVGSSTSSDIYMTDTDEGTRRIHCNSNRIGFLNQDSGWGSYCSDNGDWTSDYISYAGASMRAPIFYDNNNTAYYTDPASTSRVYSIFLQNVIDFPTSSGASTGRGAAYNIYQESGGWSHPYPDLCLGFHTGLSFGAYSGYGGMRFFTDYDLGTIVMQINGSSGYIFKYNWMYTNTTGMYSDSYSAHIYPNSGSSYTQWRIDGSKNGYGGIWDAYSAVSIGMYDSAGNGGVYREANGRWFFYHNVSNNCMGVNTSSTSSSYGLYVDKGIYSTGNVVAYSDARRKTNIKTIDNAVEKVLQLRGVTYNKLDVENNVLEKIETGVIAQEVEPVFPEVVTYAEDIDEYGVSYGNFAGLFIEAFKEQNELINMLRKEVEELKFKLGD